LKRVHKLPAGSHNGGESRFQHRQVGARQDGRDDGVAIVRRIGVGRRAADDGRVGQRADSGRPQQRAEQQRSAAARFQRAERVRANPRQIGRAAVGRELRVLQRDGQTVDKRGLQRVGGTEVLNGNGIAEQLAGLRDSRGGGLDHGEVGRSLDGRFNRVGIVLRVGVGRIAGNGDGVGQRARKRRVYPPADRQQETAARRQRTGGVILQGHLVHISMNENGDGSAGCAVIFCWGCWRFVIFCILCVRILHVQIIFHIVYNMNFFSSFCHIFVVCCRYRQNKCQKNDEKHTEKYTFHNSFLLFCGQALV